MRDKIKRYVVFMIGLCFSSLGVAFVTKASLGTSPISSIPYVLSLNLRLTLGNYTIIMSLVLVVLQLLILGKHFKPEYALQIPVSFAFGYLIDLGMWLIASLDPQFYLFKIAVLLVGCFILSVGVWIEVIANVVMLPGESFVRACVFRLKIEFGYMKIIFDVCITVIAIILSFVLSGELNGVREGTVIAALVVGYLARRIGKWMSFVPAKLFPEEGGEGAKPLIPETSEQQKERRDAGE